MAYAFADKTTWGVDAVGVVSHRPVWLRYAVMYPNAIDDAVTFKSWQPQGELGTTEHVVLDNYANPPLNAGGFRKKGATLYAPMDETYVAEISVSGNNTVSDPNTNGTFFTAAKVGTPPSIMRVIWTEDGTNYRATAGPHGAGLGGNLLVVTRTDNDNIIVATGAGQLSNEANKDWSWWMVAEDANFNTAFAIHALQTGGSDTIVQGAVMFDFGPSGKWFPNLACTALSTSASVDLYLK